MKIQFKNTYEKYKPIWFINTCSLKISESFIVTNYKYFQERSSIINIILAIFHNNIGKDLNKGLVLKTHDNYLSETIPNHNTPLLPPTVPGSIVSPKVGTIPNIFITESKSEIENRFEMIYKIINWLPHQGWDPIMNMNKIKDYDICKRHLMLLK